MKEAREALEPMFWVPKSSTGVYIALNLVGRKEPIFGAFNSELGAELSRPFLKPKDGGDVSFAVLPKQEVDGLSAMHGFDSWTEMRYFCSPEAEELIRSALASALEGER